MASDWLIPNLGMVNGVIISYIVAINLARDEKNALTEYREENTTAGQK